MDDIYIKNIVHGVLQTSKWMALLTEDYVPLMVEFHRFFLPLVIWEWWRKESGKSEQTLQSGKPVDTGEWEFDFEAECLNLAMLVSVQGQTRDQSTELNVCVRERGGGVGGYRVSLSSDTS